MTSTATASTNPGAAPPAVPVRSRGHLANVLRRVLRNPQAMLGAAVTAAASSAGLHGVAVTAGAAVLAFALRVLAMRYGWRTPRPRGVPD